jgi:hypothetical protein
MKNKTLRIVLPGILLAGGLGAFSCVHQLSDDCHSGIVKIEKERILLTGVPISPPDWKKLEHILKQFDRSLYQIDVFKSSEHVKTLGNLASENLDQVTAAKVAEKAKGCPDFSGWGDQIGYASSGSSTHNHLHSHVGSSVEAGTSSGSSTHPTPAPRKNEMETGEMAASSSGSSTHPSPTPHVETTTANEMAASSSGSSTHPSPTPHHGLSDDQKELLRRVKPILEKYTHKQTDR